MRRLDVAAHFAAAASSGTTELHAVVFASNGVDS